MQSTSTQANGKLRRDIGKIGLLFSAVGSIIGSGWLFGALNAAEIAGPASIIAWVIGGVMIMLIGLCYAELGTMFPVSGGVVRFPHFAFGSFASYTLGWITWLAAASVTAIEVLATLQYANVYIGQYGVPDLMQSVDGAAILTDFGLVIAVLMLALFSFVNVIGIRWFARLNNALVWWKLIVILIVIAAFWWAAFTPEHFHQSIEGGFMPFGWNGVFSSVATAGIVFSYLGFRQGVELAGETKNPQRNVPLAIIGSVVITLIIYVGLQIAFIGSLPFEALANGWANIGTTLAESAFGPLAVLATTLGLTWLALLLYVDAIVSPADTGLIFSTVTTRLSYAMGKNSNAPASLAKISKQGVPWVSVILTFVAGCIFLLPFPGWSKLVGFVTSATVLSFGSGPLSVLAMRRQFPDMNRPFRLPWVLLLCFLAFLSSNLIIFWSGWDVVWKLMIAVAIGYSVLLAHEYFYHDKTPNLEIKSGSWVLVWLAGLTLISYLGNYPLAEKGAGNLGYLEMSSAFLVNAIFSALVIWYALATRLPDDKAKEHLSQMDKNELPDKGYDSLT